MNKKSLLFSFILIFIALAALSMAMHTLTTLEEEVGKTKYVSQRSFEILKASMYEDKFNIYITRSAEFSSEQAIDLLSKNSGFLKIEDACGGITEYRNKNYAVWNTVDTPKTICIPNYYLNFITVFNKALNLRLMDFTALENKVTHINNYEYFIKDSKLYGIALKPMLRQIKNPKIQSAEGTYAFRPSFTIDMKYDIQIYKEFNEIAEKIIDECANKFPDIKAKQSCVNNIIQQQSLSIIPRFFDDSAKGTVLLLEITKKATNPVSFALYLPSN